MFCEHTGFCNLVVCRLQLPFLIISSAVLTVALTTIALIKAVPKFYRKVASHIERGNQWYAFFWAANFMASVYNIYNLCVVL